LLTEKKKRSVVDSLTWMHDPQIQNQCGHRTRSVVKIKLLAHEFTSPKASSGGTCEREAGGRRERGRTAAAWVPGRGGREENDGRLAVGSGGSSLFPRERGRPARFNCWIDRSIRRAIQLVSLCAGAPDRAEAIVSRAYGGYGSLPQVTPALRTEAQG
jgi:hypothetical protein